MTDRDELLDGLRPVSFAVAYRMLGSVAEAEDVVQEALLRLHRALDRSPIASPRAYLVTITTRLAINELRSARVRRERYVGDWLPEPVLTAAGPDEAAETADLLSVAVLVLLESLSPEQRAALLLHDVFGYGYPEVAAIVRRTEGAVRQLVSRARRQVRQGRPRYPATRQQRAELARRFAAAAGQGDLAGLEALLAEDVAMAGDGGGRAPALARSLHGRDRVAGTLIGWSRLVARGPAASVRAAEVNGGAGVLFTDAEQRLLAVCALEVAGGRVTRIDSVLNPDKLAPLGPVGDLAAVLRSARAP